MFTKILCFFGIHSWDKWKEVEKANIVEKNDHIIGKHIIQKRACECCGKAEYDKQSIFV